MCLVTGYRAEVQFLRKINIFLFVTPFRPGLVPSFLLYLSMVYVTTQSVSQTA
jgi:hypothetical protein